MTNGKKSGIIVKHSKSGCGDTGWTWVRRGEKKGIEGSIREGVGKSLEKNFEKLLKNPLTNRKKSGIINRLSQRDGTERHGEKPDGQCGQIALIFEN